MEVSLLSAFVSGLASFLMPCVLPMIPVYLASLAGPGTINPDAPKPARSLIIALSASFVVGFSLVFIFLGSVAGLIGTGLSPNSPTLKAISGGLLISFGLFMLASVWIPFLNFEKRLRLLPKGTGYIHASFLGAIFALGWTPCLGPILGSILVLALSRETVWEGMYLLTSYSLGLGLPFILAGALLGWLTPLLRWLGRYSRWIYLVMASLLIITGVFTITGRLDWLY